MAVTIKTGEFSNLGKCVFISNGDAELIVTIDIGPRVSCYRAFGGENIFLVDEERNCYSDNPSIMENYGKEKYYFLGGHRLWATPEIFPDTYCPDDVPLDWREIPGGAIFTTKPEANGMQYEIEVVLDETGSGVSLAGRIYNTGKDVRVTAPWTITQCRPGGMSIAPQNTRECSPLPNRLVVHWPYNDMHDPRFTVSKKYFTLRQDADASVAFKYGINNEAGWAGYLIDGQLFVKDFGFDMDANYPDYGCNFESWTDKYALEVESLGSVREIKPGEFVELRERWVILPAEGEVPAPGSDEFAEYIDRVLGK